MYNLHKNVYNLYNLQKVRKDDLTFLLICKFYKLYTFLCKF